MFNLRPPSAIIADANPELINAYQAIATDVHAVIAHLRHFNVSEADYYRIRAIPFETLDKNLAAARTIYLNKTCYKGLYRVNKSGRFNVPYGHYKQSTLCLDAVLYAAAEALQGVKIVQGDYKAVLLKEAKRGDFIYLDPPYLSTFNQYTVTQFQKKEHRALAVEVKRLHALGCHVLLTNAYHPFINALYRPFTTAIVNTHRRISVKQRISRDIIVSTSALPLKK